MLIYVDARTIFLCPYLQRHASAKGGLSPLHRRLVFDQACD